MLEAIQRFITRLRRAGVRISTAEAIDAARAARAVGVEDREALRLALGTALAKSRPEGETFERTFRSFFTSPAAPRPQGKGRRGAASASGAAKRRAREQDETPPRRARPGRLRVVLERARGRRPLPVAPPPRAAAAPHRAPRGPRPRRRPLPRRRATPLEGSSVRKIDLTARAVSPADDERLAREMPRVIREIRLLAGRRYRRGRGARVWTARLLRENVGTGGVPFVIPMKRRRPRRPRVIILADVSWSVMRASSLFLMLATGFLKQRARTSVYLFVDRCVDATGTLARWKGPSESPFASLLAALPDLDPRAPSDYGRAFYQAAHARRGAEGGIRTGSRDTILIVMGDARSNERDPQAWAFEELAARCRRVIWLNPEPHQRWNTGDSILDAYLPSCDVVCEARDLDGLARGVSEIVRSLR